MSRPEPSVSLGGTETVCAPFPLEPTAESRKLLALMTKINRAVSNLEQGTVLGLEMYGARSTYYRHVLYSRDNNLSLHTQQGAVTKSGDTSIMRTVCCTNLSAILKL